MKNQIDHDHEKDLSYYSLDRSYDRVNRFLVIIVFVTSIIGAGTDTFSYYSNRFYYLFSINLFLITFLFADLFLLLTKKLTLKTAFILLLYVTLLNITLTHIHEFKLEHFIARTIFIGFWGILFIVLSCIVLGKFYPYLVMFWADTLLILDVFRANSNFLKEAIPIIAVTLAAVAFGLSMYVKLLRESFQKNQNALAEISRQKSYIENQTEELETINSDLTELQNLQNDLIEMLVHDMKNPLNIIINEAASPVSKTAGKQIHEAGRQLLVLVENMLDVQKMENTDIQLELKAINLSEAIQDAITQIEHLINQQAIKTKVDVDNNIFVKADREILIRVLVNLFTNALKHSPPNSCLKIFSEQDENHMVILNVQDQGEGIPEQYTEKVFEKFIQVISRESGSARSTGLGLAFCKMSIESMKGEIWIADSSSKGTTISFSLPLGQKAGKIKYRVKLSSREISFTEDEKRLILPIVLNIKNLDLYKAGLILQELAKVPLKNEHFKKWVEDVKNSVYSVNREKFQHLLDMANTT